MAKKKKKKEPGEFLSRAEKLFAQESFLQAKNEYEKAKKAAGPGEIKDLCNQQIEICEQYLNKDQDKAWVKKGFKHLNKDETEMALSCFEKAFHINPETWLKEKIETLSLELKQAGNLEKAGQAETKGDFLEAAKYYGLCYQFGSEQKYLQKQALCLVKAGEYEQAIEIYADLDSGAEEVNYNYGYALACQGDYYAGLQTWFKLKSEHPDFAAQKQEIAQRLKAELLQKWSQKSLSAEDYLKIKEVLKFDVSEEALTLGRNLRLEWIKQNCLQNNYARVAEELSACSPCPDLKELILWAQVFFLAAEQTDKHLDKLPAYWLTAILRKYYLDNEQKDQSGLDKLRQELYRQTEEIFKSWEQKGSEQAKRLFAYFNKEKEVSESFFALTHNIFKQYDLVCSPCFAALCALNTQIMSLLLRHKQDIRDFSALKHPGAYYSAARESLMLLEEKNYGLAYEKLPAGQEQESEEGFIDYARVKVTFMYGLECLKKDSPLPGRFVQTCLQAIDMGLGVKEHIYNLLYLDLNSNQLQSLEKLLKQLLVQRSAMDIKPLLSEVMTDRGLQSFNQGQMNDQNLKKILEQALDLDPGNQHAHNQLQITKKDIEIQRIRKLNEEAKFYNASKLALNSGYEEVRDAFFKDIQMLSEDLYNRSIEPELRKYLLGQMFDACKRVDPEHPLTQEIEQSLTVSN